MDELDLIVLRNTNKVIIESISVFAGNNCGNVIRVQFTTKQDSNLLQELPWSRLTQWMISKNVDTNLRIDNIPDTLDADEIATWLAKELKAKGKTVILKKWIAPSTFNTVVI